MTDSIRKALLPTGLRDLLPPEAEHEARAVAGLLAGLRAHGYERVKPPLLEFEDTLLGGDDQAVAGRTFRLMDPVSRRMMGVRADITPQIARIAATRLGAAPRPLRLCYAGEVMRVTGTQLRPERQFCQVGAELIGAAQAAAGDAEIVLLAAEMLAAIGVTGLSIDLNLPTLVPMLCAGLDLDVATAERLRLALDRKDAAAVAAIDGAGGLFGALLAAAGPAEPALAALAALDLPAAAATAARRLTAVVTLILDAHRDMRLTVDPVENRGFEYHTGVGFTIFADGARGELGCGGRYRAEAGLGARAGDGEPATGFTLFMDTVLRVLPTPEPAARLFLPLGAPAEAGARLRDEGWITVRGLTQADDDGAEARRLECSHALVDGRAVPVTEH